MSYLDHIIDTFRRVNASINKEQWLRWARNQREEEMDYFEAPVSRYDVMQALALRYGTIDVIGWYPRKMFQGYTTVYLRIRGENAPRNVRVFDGGLVEELPETFYLDSEGC